MGNYVSCALAGGPGGGSRSAKVILPGGAVQRVEGPATAAEMMLNAPGHFVVDSQSMHAGRRFAPLAADEELEMGHVYAMFPMKRAGAVVTAADMAALLLAAQREVRREAGGARVLPDRPMIVGPETENTAAAELGKGMEGAAAAEIGEFKYRPSMCRSRRPNLETIHEEGICFSR
ncbi:uncharacterized protein LOC122004580 [Zingiber officinale]|uniref:Uncharacterized protein n=1 Tax=Zingiber officinale TaxID=94328 RepID=A0A8J5FMH1_ZINOF|nr:uncharacterized protein LOC122004580 [Zingiber officinale]KAG6490409.1 hypothetical protein ZIOFF_051705 [Zingiber officinale]